MARRKASNAAGRHLMLAKLGIPVLALAVALGFTAKRAEAKDHHGHGHAYGHYGRGYGGSYGGFYTPYYPPVLLRLQPTFLRLPLLRGIWVLLRSATSLTIQPDLKVFWSV